MIYTGPIDEFFDYRYGKLPYHCEFKHETLNTPVHQPVAVVNYPNEHLYTRNGVQIPDRTRTPKTSIVYSTRESGGRPLLPVPRSENAELYKKTRRWLTRLRVHFVGWLATYKYYNMDQVVAQTLTLYTKLAGASN